MAIVQLRCFPLLSEKVEQRLDGANFLSCSCFVRMGVPFFPVSTSSVSQLISNCGDVFVVTSGFASVAPITSALSVFLCFWEIRFFLV